MEEHLERRYVEVKAASDSREVYGTVVPYNTTATVTLPGGLVFDEVVVAGAFRNRAGPVFLNRQHDRSLMLAKLGKNLELTDTAEAMTFRATMPKTPLGEDTLVLVREGILSGASITWSQARDSWSGRTRTIHASNLRHFSIVDDPVYEDAVVSARAKQYLVGFEQKATPTIHRAIRSF